MEGKGGNWKTMVGFLVLVMGGKGVQWFWGVVFDRSLTLVLIPGWAFVCWAKREWAWLCLFWIGFGVV